MNYKMMAIFAIIAATTLSLVVYSSSTFASNAFAATTATNASSLSSAGTNQQNTNSSNNNEISKLRVLNTFEVKEGKKQELLNTIVPALDSARKEPGNIFFNLYASTQNPNEILVDQLWSSKAAYDQHHNLPQTIKINQLITSLAVKPQVYETYTAINATQ